MREMTVDNVDIVNFGARLLNFSIGGTDLEISSGISLNANFPKLFRTDYGQREIKIILVFKPKHFESTVRAKMNCLTMQKSKFDGILYGKVIDIHLPDGFYYKCILQSVGAEIFDGESMEVSYTLNGIRHLPIADPSGTQFYCYSTVRTDCRITIRFISGWNDTAFKFAVNRNTKDHLNITIDGINNGDVLLIDGMEKRVIKNGNNIFGDTNIITFPYLIPAENKYVQLVSGECTFKTEYYPTLI